MAKNGIIIDVGFKPDIQEFVNEIQSSFKKIDFDNMIGLEESFKKQQKNVEKQLSTLSKKINDAVNGNIKGDPSQYFQTLNQSVATLSTTIQAMADAMPQDMASKFAGNIHEMTTNVDELSQICINGVSSIDKLQKASGKKIEFVDSSQLKDLEQTYVKMQKILKEVPDLLSVSTKKKSGNKAFSDLFDVSEELEQTYQKLSDAQLKYDDALESGDVSQIDKTSQALAQLQNDMLRLMKTYEDMGGSLRDKLDFGGVSAESISGIKKEIESEFDELRNYLQKRVVEINDLYGQISSDGSNLESKHTKSYAKDGNSNRLTVPLDISTTAEGLETKALEIINTVQNKLHNQPLEIEVKLISSYTKSKKNQEVLNEIRNGLNNISDQEVKEKLSSLVNNMNKDINDSLLFTVKVNTESATVAVKQFTKEATELLKTLSKSALISPEIELTDERKAEFEEQLNKIKDGLKINVGITNEADGDKSAKKEIDYLISLKKKVELITEAVDAKSLAFIDEESIVKGVVTNESDLLNHLYGDLIAIEEQVKDIVGAFSLIPKDFAINFDTDSLNSLNGILNNSALTEIASAKKSIQNAVASGAGNAMVIPTDQKETIAQDIKDLTDQIQKMYNTDGIQKWSNEFIEALNKISQKLKSLFGNDNALSKMLEEWNYADKLMVDWTNPKFINERSAVIGSDGKIYGSGTYGDNKSTPFINHTARQMSLNNIQPKVGIHSHASDNIATASLIQGKDLSGDLYVSYCAYIQSSIEKQLIVALKDLQVFDAKGFFDSNSQIDFKNSGIRNKIKNAVEEKTQDIYKQLNSYFEDFVKDYGSKDGSSLLGNTIGNNTNVEKFLTSEMDSQAFLDDFYNNLKIQGMSVKSALFRTILESIESTFGDQGTLTAKLNQAMGTNMSEDSVEQQIVNIATRGQTQFYKILENSFGLQGLNFSDKGSHFSPNGLNTVPTSDRDLLMYAMRKETPNILSTALKGTKYKNNFKDYMKTYKMDDFISQNPLGLSSGSLSEMFNTAVPSEFLGALDKIVEDLTQIKTLSSGNELKDIFNVKFDEGSLKSFTDQINQLIDIISKLPELLNKGLTNVDAGTATGEIDKVTKQIDENVNSSSVNTVESLSKAIKDLIDSGTASDKLTEFLTTLNKSLNTLGGSKSEEKIQKISDNLLKLKESLKSLDSVGENGFIQSLSSILSDGEKIKSLSGVIKTAQSTTPKTTSADARAQKTKDNYSKASELLSNNDVGIRSSVLQKFGSENVISQSLKATKDGYVQVIALVKEGENAYKKYTYAVEENLNLQQRGSDEINKTDLKQIKLLEALSSMTEKVSHTQLGEDDVTFTPESEGWDQLVSKAQEFGIKLEDIQKIVRNVDREGQESFQIFTELSRITVGMDSSGVLFRYDSVLDKDVINKFKTDVSNLSKIMAQSFKGNDNATLQFVDSLKNIQKEYQRIMVLKNQKLIDASQFENATQYTESFLSSLSKMSIDRINALNPRQTEEYADKVQLATVALTNLDAVIAKVHNQEPFDDQDINQVTAFSSAMQDLFNTVNDKGSKMSPSISQSKLFSKIADSLSKNSAMSKELKQDFMNLSAEMHSFGGQIPADKLNEFTERFFKLDAQMKEAGETGRSFFDMITSRAKGMSATLIAQYFSLYDAIRYIKELITYVQELDTAMVELRKVTDGTEAQYTQFKKTIAESAKAVASTNSDLISSAADWARLGYSIEQAADLAKSSAVFVNVGDGIDITSATEDMITAMKAFDIEAEDSMKIVDEYNEVGNHFAISASGIGEGMQRSASALAVANNTFEQSIALITAMNEIMQDPEKTGTTLKVMSLRLRGATTEIEEMGESTDGMAESTSKLQAKVAALTNTDGKGGINILTESGDFKSTYDIIEGIASKWSEMKDMDQAALLELIAGKVRANGVASLLKNWKQLDKVVESASNAEGSAMKENQAVVDSIQGRITKFKASIEQLANDYLSSNLVKGVVNFGTKFVNVLDQIIEKFGSLGTTIGAVMIGLQAKSLLSGQGGGRAKKLALNLICYRSVDGDIYKVIIH